MSYTPKNMRSKGGNFRIFGTLLFFIMCSFTAAEAKDCGPTLQTVKVSDPRLSVKDNRLKVSFLLDLSEIEEGKNQQIVYTPMIVSDAKEDTVVLKKIVVNGRNTAILEERDKKKDFSSVFATIRRVNKTRQVVAYNDSVAYEPWMELCRLSLAEDICGCGELQVQDYVDLNEFDNRPAPEPYIEFIAPMAEEVKTRHLSGSAFVDFIVNKTDIRPDYRNNRREINKILETIDVVRNDTNVRITEITIHGYASPEGSYQNNVRLAAGRAEALKEYVRSLYTLEEGIFKSQSTPEDWEGLRKRVVASTFPEKTDLLAIIDDPYLDPDSKDKMMKTKFPTTYKFMLEEWYPALRHSDYTVSYIVKPFTVEETKRMLEKNPGQVSLNEIFRVAQTYDPGSEEFNNIMKTALLLYPNDETANLNAANAAIKAGDLAAAEKYLEKSGNSPQVINAKGVIAMERGDYELAKKLFTQAVDMGLDEAKENIEVAERKEKLQQQSQ